MLPNRIIKKRILITGANGMLGQRLVKIFSQYNNYTLLATSVENESVIRNIDYAICDISIRDDIKNLILNFYPDVVVHTAAFTNVDLSEKEREQCWKINVKAVEYITEACRVLGNHLIHISTDYIFDGTSGPYNENAPPNPLGYYARTKLASENVLRMSGVDFTIIRTNVLYGIADSRPDFVRWVINKLKSNDKINIVTDQINNPTFIDDMVQAISKIIEFKKYGVYNIGGSEFISRYDFALKIADFFNLNRDLIFAIVTKDLNQPARRPLKSGLIITKAQAELNYKPYTIDEALTRMKEELNL
ncbi:MAG: dTDP-4-dehydrorhamnose reductase [Ignavibacteriales bacterium]|nr:dTDP-4-dehydrorhamnose reductase [Ignavibacteriales bacterium]